MQLTVDCKLSPAAENNKPTCRKHTEYCDNLHKPIFLRGKLNRDERVPIRNILGFKSPIPSKYFGNLSVKPFSDKSQQKLLNTTCTIKHLTQPTKMNPFSNVKSETVISKHLLWPFRSYIWWSIFRHSSNEICHSAHNSFLAVLASNGTSENRKL